MVAGECFRLCLRVSPRRCHFAVGSFGPPNAAENKPVDFKLYSTTPQPGEQFGWSLDLDVDEEGTCRAVIGAPGRSHEIYTNSDGTRLANAGAAYVYVLDNDGCWILEQRLTLPMVDFEWSNDGASDIEAGTGTKVQVFPISDWPERLPYDPFDPNADPDTLNEQLRIGVNAPQNEAVPVELSALSMHPTVRPMASFPSPASVSASRSRSLETPLPLVPPEKRSPLRSVRRLRSARLP